MIELTKKQCRVLARVAAIAATPIMFRGARVLAANDGMIVVIHVRRGSHGANGNVSHTWLTETSAKMRACETLIVGSENTAYVHGSRRCGPNAVSTLLTDCATSDASSLAAMSAALATRVLDARAYGLVPRHSPRRLAAAAKLIADASADADAAVLTIDSCLVDRTEYVRVTCGDVTVIYVAPPRGLS